MTQCFLIKAIVEDIPVPEMIKCEQNVHLRIDEIYKLMKTGKSPSDLIHGIRKLPDKLKP